MKISLLLLAMVLMSEYGFSQTYSQTFILCDKSYTVSTAIQLDKSITVSLIKSIKVNPSDTARTYTVKNPALDDFAKTFSSAFLTFFGDSACNNPAKTEELQGIGRNIFFNMLRANTDNTAPEAGVLKLYSKARCEEDTIVNNSHPIHKDTTPSKTKDVGAEGQIIKMIFEIKDGYLENIKVYINIKDIEYIFTNLYGIGISNVKNIKAFPQTCLYSLPNATGKIYKVSAANVFNYDYAIDLNRRDYSPQDIRSQLNGGETLTLYKDETSKLFEAQIYTDFLGLNENKPNGLIQVEASKKINISTVQKLVPRPFFLLAHSIGSFQYISPNITLSKIEQHRRSLVLSDLDSLRLNPGGNDTTKLNSNLHRYTTLLNLYQYQTFSAGVDLNLITLANHDLKYTFYLNLGAKLGLTSVTDSLTKINDNVITKTGLISNYTVTTLQWYPSVSMLFSPEGRFNFVLSDKVMHIRAYNSKFEQLSFDKLNNKKFTIPTHSWLNIFEMLMTVRVNADSKLFGRLRYNYELKNMNENFAQVQVGYSTYILGRR
jgi:hypothetical protein